MQPHFNFWSSGHNYRHFILAPNDMNAVTMLFYSTHKWDEDDCEQLLREDFERDGHGLFEGISISLFSPI
jgi:hypothetical protein